MSHPAKAQAHHPAGSRVHGAGVLREAEHDAYRPRGKWPAGTRCRECHAQVQRGRWVWGAPEPAPAVSDGGPARQVLCPACRRQREDQAAADLRLTGRYVTEHARELLALVQQVAARELAEHPLERLMQVEQTAPQQILIRTTGLHLPRALGHALQRTFHGRLQQAYAPDSLRLRVQWHRDD